MNYFKEAIKRGLLGLISALCLHHTLFFIISCQQSSFTIESSFFIGHYLIYGLSGFYFSAISVLFNMNMTIKRKFGIHILLTAPFLPVAYITGFMPSHITGQLTFVFCYMASYILSFILYKRKGKVFTTS